MTNEVNRESCIRDAREYPIVMREDLCDAICYILKPNGMSSQNDIAGLEKASMDEAERILNIFGYSNEVVDNVFEPQDREDFMYPLEKGGIFRTGREETYLLKGKTWRAFYWIFRKDELLRLAREYRNSKVPVPKQAEDHGAIYGKIPPETWQRGEGMGTEGTDSVSGARASLFNSSRTKQ